MKMRTYRLNHPNGQQEKGWIFWCPACKQEHRYCTKPVGGVRSDGRPWPRWTMDGTPEAPTFRPSLLYQVANGKLVDGKWVEGNRKWTICHLHVTRGLIQYCGDCPHELAGKTVPMVDLPECST